MARAVPCRLMEIGFCVAWTAYLDGHLIFFGLHRHGFRERYDKGFGGGVFSHIGNWEKSCHGSYIDNGTLPSIHHIWKEKSGAFCGHMDMDL